MAHQYSPTDVVLVTGANGHIAQHIVSQLLSLPSGPIVRATVRSDTSARPLETHFKSAISANRLQVVRVPDIIADGAFDDAIKGVTHIAHVASPLPEGCHVASVLLDTAIKGTVGLLKAALTEPKVKAIAITSSFGAIFDAKHGFRSGYTYTSADWNPITYEQASDPNLDLTAYPEKWRFMIAYMASKKLAEEAAWHFHAEHRPNWGLAVVNPTRVAGPHVLPLSKGADSLSESGKIIMSDATSKELQDQDFAWWVDVRDVAKAHIEALVRPQAWGKRWVLSAEPATASEVAEISRRNFPELQASQAEQKHFDGYAVDGKPALQELGIGQYIPLEKTVVDTLRQVLEQRKKN